MPPTPCDRRDVGNLLNEAAERFYEPSALT
jgi:hypothetical protein